jgi:hypothetical protein
VPQSNLAEAGAPPKDTVHNDATMASRDDDARLGSRRTGSDVAAETEPARTRLLIVTGGAVTDVAELPPLIRSLVQAASDILVVTPVLPGRLQWLASDTDRVRHEADDRLQTVLAHVESVAPGVAASGQIGDETPLSAFADAVHRFAPDHILVALRASDHSGWQERQLTDRVLAEFHIPLTVFEIDRAGGVATTPD